MFLDYNNCRNTMVDIYRPMQYRMNADNKIIRGCLRGCLKIIVKYPLKPLPSSTIILLPVRHYVIYIKSLTISTPIFMRNISKRPTSKRRPLSILMALTAITYAVAATVTGRISDNSGLPVTGAVVAIIKNQKPIDAVLSDENGNFRIETPDTGHYTVKMTFPGMDTVYRDVRLSYPDSVVDLGNLEMTEKGITLAEAIVTGVKTAVTTRQDTIEFNAGSFRTAPNATVEDLLKKLPGVEVGSDGSITSGGKSITKILIDGKEFFNDDPKMASKNLPSDMVDKVQVVDRKSDLARLTGVDDGEEETVINLTVKKDRQNGWFGNISGAYGTDRRYNASFVINRFQNGNQFTILGGLNNVNDMGFTDGGAGRFMSFGAGGGILTSRRLGFNFNTGNGEKFRIGGNVMYSYTDRDSRSKSATQYLFPDSTSWSTQGTTARDKGHNLRADFRMQWKIDDNTTIDFRPRLAFNSRRSNSTDTSFLRAGDPQMSLVNSSENRRANSGNSWQANGELILNHNFPSHPGRSFSVQLNYAFSSTRQRSTSLSDLIYYLAYGNDEELERFIDSKTWSNTFGGRLTWTEPLGDASRGNFLSVAYRAQYKTNNADKYTYNLDPEMIDIMPEFPTSPPEGIEADPDLSDRFRNNFLSQELQVGYKKVNKKLNLEAGVVFAPSQSESHDLIDSRRDIPTRYVWNVAPYARIRYRFNTTTSLSANYRARTTEASMSALQPVADVSDPLHIIVGNPELKPTFTQSVRMHFNSFNASSQQSIFAVMSASYSLNTVVNRTTTDPLTGIRTTTYSNVDGNFNIFGMGMITRPIGQRHWRLNAHLGARYTNSAGYINGDFNRSGNLNLNPRFGITYSNDWFQMSVNPAYTLGIATNSLDRQPNQTTHTYGFSTDATLTLPFGLSVSTDLDFSASTGYLSGFNTSRWLWNARIDYSFLRDKSLTIFAEAHDILRQQTDISRTVSANMISDRETNDLSRYFLIGLTWKFNTLGKKSTSGINPQEMPDDFHRPGQGGQRPPGSGHREPRGPGRSRTF